MWIVPKNIPTNKRSYLFATDTEVSKKEFLTSFELEQSLMWRSKLFKSSTWYQRWKRIWWIRHLFGRILKPSMQNHFTEKYTESLEDIPVKEKVLQERESCGMTLDSFGHILNELSSQLDLFGASSKMLLDTSQVLSPTFLKAYDLWVTKLRQDCLRRLKLAHHTNEKEFLSLHVPTLESSGDVWPTMTISTGAYQTSLNGTIRPQLSMAVIKWASPTARDGTGTDCPADRKRNSPGLPSQVNLYPTPQASETEKATKDTKQESLSKMAINGQLPWVKDNTVGKPTERLNPEWVAQLMGTTLEQSFFASMATEL